MASFWKCAATAALSTLFWAGSTVADLGTFSDIVEYNNLANMSLGYPRQYYQSSPIIGPLFQCNTYDPQAVDNSSYFFLGTVYGPMKGGPMIVNARDLSLVYADQRYENTYSSNVQEIDGKPYLTFWQGGHTRGHANGKCMVYDEEYRLVYEVTAQGLNDSLADMHEMKFTNNKSVIFTTYWNKPYDCSSIGGPVDGFLMDSGFQEVDLETNEVIFNWAASDHFTLLDSYANYSSAFGVSIDSGFDFAHVNSVDKTDDGNYLVSSRHLSSLALIDGTDGHPIWILGGNRNQFFDLSNGQAINFAWQHDARFYKNQSHITMFDNHGEATGFCEGPCFSRGLHIEIDPVAMTAGLVREFYHPEAINSGAMGGMRILENGNALVSWGYNPTFVEYKPDGTPVLDAQRGMLGLEFLDDMFAYRVHKHNWVGRPTWPPALAVQSVNGTTQDATVFASWNGATEVAKWAVFASVEIEDINKFENLLTYQTRTGFETVIPLGNHTLSNQRRYVGVAALDAAGEVLGSSPVMNLTLGGIVVVPSNIDADSFSTSRSSSKGKANKSSSESQGADETASNFHGFAASFGAFLAGAAVVGVGGYFWQRRMLPKASSIEETKYELIDSEERRV